MEGWQFEQFLIRFHLSLRPWPALQLQDPGQYGLTATQGLQLVARIFTTVTDVYANASSPDDVQIKNQWMVAFVDVCYSLILDDGVLKGMLTNSPSTSSLEALASTEFMTVRAMGR